MWLACTKLPVWKLDMLARSPSFKLEASDVPSPEARASLSAFLCCNALVNCSQGKASSTFSVRVGSRARTVIVQSVWFCSKRLRILVRVNRLHSPKTRISEFLLLLCDPVELRSLPCLIDLVENILSDKVCASDNCCTYSYRLPISAKPLAN